MPRRRPSQSPVAELIEFKNAEKVFYPATGFTKGEVIRYYLEIAPVLLPHLLDRPVTLKRYPDGIHGKFFYEKDAPGYTPEWVPRFPVPRRGGGEPIDYILVNDARVLAWCSNLATIEFHPFLHRVPELDRPTAVAFDLDPGEGADLRLCAKVALRLRSVLSQLGLQAYPKVSGSKGLQVYVPLNTETTYAATQAFAKSIAELLEREHTREIVSDMAKERRRGKVFIDWSQNSDFKTTVAVYSLRAKREEPYVSMPVTWEEVEHAKSQRGADALYFAPAAALKRIDALGDLFEPVLTGKQALPAAFAAVKAAGNRTASRSSGAPRTRHRSPATPSTRVSQRALRDYAAKRDFSSTPEPNAAPRRSAQGSRRRFVIQKHAASHLHYDFRLEMSGVLRSWAVPKGLPYALEDRRSAFATEDHPLEYLMFEGIIPQGQYGGGTVMVWDAGTYDVVEGNYWKGFLRVYLKGRKMKGEWTLNREEESDGKSRWLMRKTGATMRAISAKRDDASAVTGRSMAEIAAAADAVWEGKREADFGGETPSAPKRAAEKLRSSPPRLLRSSQSARARPPRREAAPAEPEFPGPMLARGVAELPEGDEWTYEVKWDGYRAIAIKYGDSVRLVSRKGNSLAADFPSVVEAVRGLDVHTAVLDGEVVALDEHGRPQFQMLQNRASASSAQIVFYAYDLLQIGSKDLRERPLAERKTELESLIVGSTLRFSANLPGSPREILKQANQLGLEGIVAKRKDSTYQPGERSGAWLKLKLSPEQEFVVAGYKPGTPLESLLVGYYDGRKLMFAGKVRQGLNPRNRVELWRALEPLRTGACPFANLPNSRKSHFGEGVTAEQMNELSWTKPKLVAQVSFTEWTTGGNLRHATYLGLRTDKDPHDVVREVHARR